MTGSLVPLGKSGIQVTPLGFGTWQWGDSRNWGYGRTYTEADVRAAFEASLAAGVHFFDTAEIYGFGESERLLGRFIRQNGRQPVIVATKFMPLPWRWRKSSLLKALRDSLDRLGLERVDLYQIHWLLPPVPIETWMDALADAVQAGWVRAVGVSNYNVEQTRRAHAALARRGVPLASNQVEYSLLRRAPERNGLLQTCRELGVTLIAYSPIAQGLLSGKYTPDHLPTGLIRRRFGQGYLQRIQPLVDLLREIGQAHGKTPSQVALNWVMRKDAVPIPGAKNVQQALDNIGALGWSLTDAQVAALDAMSDQVTVR